MKPLPFHGCLSLQQTNLHLLPFSNKYHPSIIEAYGINTTIRLTRIAMQTV